MIQSKLDDQTAVIPTRHRNILFGGLALALRGLPALLWTYVLSLGIALLFSTRLYGQWNALLSHSFATQSLTSGFDLGTLAGGVLRISERVPGGNSPSFGGVAVFAIVSFLLVPGTLFCYAAPARARLSTLLRAGVEHFWRFVRITLLTLVIGGLILGALSAINTALADRLNEHIVGRPAFVLEAVGVLLLFLVATIVRLYFDLVEVYTVQLGLQTAAGPKARPDRRIRRTLRPAWYTLARHFASGWLTFLLLTVLGLGALALAVRFTVVSLAQPRVWPAFAIMQIGLLINLFTRFWQRGAETVLAQNHPLPQAPIATARPVFAPSAAPASPRVTSLETPVTPVTPANPVYPVVPSEPLPADSQAGNTYPPEVL